MTIRTGGKSCLSSSYWGACVNAVLDCTVPEKILIAAYELEQQGQSPFSAEALIVASWQKFPVAFGLRGYAELYPDSNKVLSSIMGEKGLARKGWLAKMGQKLYTLTREGRHVATRVLQVEDPDAGPKPLKLSRENEKLLLGLLDSSAAAKFQENRKHELTFADACRFWNINESLHADVIQARMHGLRASLSELQQALAEEDAVLSNGRSVAVSDVGLVTKVHKHLEERFSRHLNLLRNRTVRN